jgi:hypothetical protein
LNDFNPQHGQPIPAHVGNPDVEKVVVTIKADGDYGAPWVVFHASSNAEAADLIGAAEATGLFALIGKSCR